MRTKRARAGFAIQLKQQTLKINMPEPFVLLVIFGRQRSQTFKHANRKFAGLMRVRNAQDDFAQCIEK
jgi:hypothetical protein